MGYRVSAASILIRVAPLCTFNEIEFLLKKRKKKKEDMRLAYF